jgi:hypothetical protein
MCDCSAQADYTVRFSRMSIDSNINMCVACAQAMYNALAATNAPSALIECAVDATVDGVPLKSIRQRQQRELKDRYELGMLFASW